MRYAIALLGLLALSVAVESCAENVTAPASDSALHAPLPGVCPCVPCGPGGGGGEASAVDTSGIGG